MATPKRRPFIYRLEKDVAASLRGVLKERGEILRISCAQTSRADALRCCGIGVGWAPWKKSDGEFLWHLQWKKARYGKEDYFGPADGSIDPTAFATAAATSSVPLLPPDMSVASNLGGPQRVNHFTKTASVTRKDMLARSMRRLARLYGPVYNSFVPLTFVLPREAAQFQEEYWREKQKACAHCTTDTDASDSPLTCCMMMLCGAAR
jgi:hypothetical protein